MNINSISAISNLRPERVIHNLSSGTTGTVNFSNILSSNTTAAEEARLTRWADLSNTTVDELKNKLIKLKERADETIQMYEYLESPAFKAEMEAQLERQKNYTAHTVWKVDGEIIGAHFDIGWTTFSNGADGHGNAQDKSNPAIAILPPSERNDQIADAMTLRLREKYGTRLTVELQQPGQALKRGYILNEMQS